MGLLEMHWNIPFRRFLRAALPFSLLLAAAAPAVAQKRPAPNRAAAVRNLALQVQVQRRLAARRVARRFTPAVSLSVLRQIGAGITKDKTGEVVEISLPTNASYSYLRYAASFKKLRTLDLSGCTSMYDTGLSYLKDVKSLQVLNLSQCSNITDGGLAHIAGLTNLTHLDLSYCRNIHDAGIGKLKGLTKLQELNLKYCTNIGDGSLKQAAGWKNLEVLDVGRCRNITSAGWATLKTMSKLRELNAEYTSLTDDDLKSIAQMPRLKTLSLKYCRFVTPAGLKHLAAGKAKLTSLSLAYHRKFSDKDLSVLLGIPTLTALNLRSTPLTDAAVPTLLKLPNLKSLDLSYVPLTDAGVEALAKLRQLEELTFYHGRFTDKGLKAIAGMPNLKRLDLTSCGGVTAAGLQDLARIKGLERLSLSSTRANEKTLEALKGLKKLKELDLSRCGSIAATGNALETVATFTSLESLNVANNSWVRKRGLKALKPLTKLKKLDLTGCRSMSSTGIGYVGNLSSLETLRMSRTGTLTSTAVQALQKLTKLKELNLDGVRMSSSTYSNLRRSTLQARITGRPSLYSVSSRRPQYSFKSAKVIIRANLDNVQKKEYLKKLKQLLDADFVTFYSVAEVAEGTQFELAPIDDVATFKEFAGKIKFGKTKLDTGSRTITVELTKKPARGPGKPQKDKKPGA